MSSNTEQAARAAEAFAEENYVECVQILQRVTGLGLLHFYDLVTEQHPDLSDTMIHFRLNQGGLQEAPWHPEIKGKPLRQ